MRRTPDQMAVDAERWKAAREAGKSVAQIAAEEGVGTGTVSRATSGPDMHGALRQTQDAATERVAGWVEERRRRVTAREIAERDGVTVAWVRAKVRPFGPFPVPARPARWTDEQAAEWAEWRRRGETLAEVAADAGVPRKWVVEAATGGRGPFWTGRRRQR
ncbi:hypothetical protein GCM10009814_14680 [Lapillicoccus jejuensis]